MSDPRHIVLPAAPTPTKETQMPSITTSTLSAKISRVTTLRWDDGDGPITKGARKAGSREHAVARVLEMRAHYNWDDEKREWRAHVIASLLIQQQKVDGTWGEPRNASRFVGEDAAVDA